MKTKKKNESLKDIVAKTANVSSMTISRVINSQPGVSEETRERVLKIIADLGYVPNETARKLRIRSHTSKTFNLGLVSTDIPSSFNTRVFNGISRAAAENGYHVFFNCTYSQLENNLTLFSKVITNENVDGVIIRGAWQVVEPTVNRIRGIIKNIVHIDAEGMESEDNFVADKVGAGLSAVKYLHGLGHREIAYVGKDDERLEGYRKGLRTLGLTEEERFTVLFPRNDAISTQMVFNRVSELLAGGRPPSAFFAFADRFAFAVMEAVKARGLKMPGDISVVGYDDIEAAADSFPPLTTLRVSMEEIGEAATRRLIERINNPAIPVTRVLFPTKLIERASAGPRNPSV